MNDDKGMLASTSTISEAVHSTPPDKQILFPLTPPATDEWHKGSSPKSPVSTALELIIQRKNLQLKGLSRGLNLRPLEFKNLLARIEENHELKNFTDSKLRLEYDPKEQALRIRMPTTIHEIFIAKVAGETTRQLQKIGDGQGNAAEFAARIWSGRSGRIRLKEFDSDDETRMSDVPYIQREPDEQFGHEDAKYPGVVYEIPYSQGGRDLDKTAWTYILYSNANVKAVVGFELGYGKGKEARLSVWKPRHVKDDEEGPEILEVETIVDHDPFRAADGSVVNATKSLQLPLDYFATSELVNFGSEDGLDITITYARLAKFLEEAEKVYRTRELAEGEEGSGKMSKRRTKRRKRPSTPIEELSSDREENFRLAERKAEERLEVEDEDFPDRPGDGVDIPKRARSKRTR